MIVIKAVTIHSAILMNMKSIRTLTLNPALDICATTDSVIPTEKLRCRDVRRDAGGGGINVARVVKRLGGDVEAIFPAGGPCGEILERLLAQEGIRFHAIPIAGETREDFTFLDKNAGRQYRFIFPGPVLSEAEWKSCLVEAITGRFDIACASGSLPPEAPTDQYARLALQYHQGGKKFLLDTAGPALLAAIKVPLYLIKPNLSELSSLLQRPLESEMARLSACEKLLADFPLEAVALSLGAEGAMLVTRQGAWQANCPPAEPVSTVGAGDSFMGGLAWALAVGLPPQDMLRCATAAGTAAVMTPGTELCHAADVWHLRQQVALREIHLSEGARF